MKKSRLMLYLLLLGMIMINRHTFPQSKIEPQPLAVGAKDNGLNICLDSAHQFLFFWHWTVQDNMRDSGFRVTGNMQVLNKTLVPGKLSLMRTQEDHDFHKQLHREFMLLPNPEFNVVITYQFGGYQDYTPDELAILRKFVNDGGGLLIFGEAPADTNRVYPAQKLVAEFSAQFSDHQTSGQWKIEKHPCTKNFTQTRPVSIAYKTIEIDAQWMPLVQGADGGVLLAVRNFGQGRIVLCANDYLRLSGKKPDDADVQPILDMAQWAAKGKKPIGGDRGVPWEYGGVGGAIYPGNREEIAGVTVLYADNQQQKVLHTIRERTKEVKALLDRMIPSPQRSADEFYIIPAAGAGGGWAVNVYTPRSASICCNDENIDDLLSIMAHEIAHTMTGPAASDGSTNGMPPEEGQGLFSEAHAGWFQKKVTHELGIESQAHDLKDLALIDPTLRELDLRHIPKDKTLWAWKKIWFIYSILEAQFSEQFYANWMREIHEYCKDKAKFHQLTWQETLVTLSHAVNADVFPLFAAFGTAVPPPENWNMPPMKSFVREALALEK